VPGLTADSKRARQNAARNERIKQAKQDQEKERLAALQEHRKARGQALGKTAQLKAQEANARSASKRNLSGGMRAGVSDQGSLIWE
jgi:hypothetical protein